jgi:hypothetical protein
LLSFRRAAYGGHTVLAMTIRGSSVYQPALEPRNLVGIGRGNHQTTNK